jgi:hypothetical protein
MTQMRQQNLLHCRKKQDLLKIEQIPAIFPLFPQPHGAAF